MLTQINICCIGSLSTSVLDVVFLTGLFKPSCAVPRFSIGGKPILSKDSNMPKIKILKHYITVIIIIRILMKIYNTHSSLK